MGAKNVAAILKNILKNATPEAESSMLKIVDANRVKDLPAAKAKVYQEAFEVLKSRDNTALIQNEVLYNEKIRNASIAKETAGEVKADTTIKTDIGNSQSKVADRMRQKYNELEAAKSLRKSKALEDTVKLDSTSATKKVGAFAPAAVLAAPSAFSNPVDILKSGLERAKQIKQSVVNKIADVTDMGLNENPYVPQYAKDHYNKAADSLLSNVSDPLNYVGGVGAADAVLGVASTAADMYDGSVPARKPATTYVDKTAATNPVQSFKVKK